MYLQEPCHEPQPPYVFRRRLKFNGMFTQPRQGRESGLGLKGDET